MAKKILIAEDDKFISKIMKFSLEAEGYKVDHVENGEDAIKKIGADGYGIVLLDLIMPIKDGFEVLKEVKKKNIKTPILVFSNLSQEDDKREALDLGAKGYYVKANVAIDELVETVKSYIK